MKKLVIVSAILVFGVSLLTAQKTPPTPAPASAPAKPGDNYSGMYTFLQEGEFVQVTVEEGGHVTGFISRFGDIDSDKGFEFLDQFFKQGKLEEKKLTFSTDTVHGEWFDFKGKIDRGEGKNVGDEAYYAIKGTLTQYTTDAASKTTAKSREVTFKSFPQDMGDNPLKPK
jgi:hypothetical protein